MSQFRIEWMEEYMDPLEWGWKVKDNMYVPIHTDKDPAPQTLINIIRCNCKMYCQSKSCSCRKHGMECTSACGQCRGMCTNGVGIDLED